MLSGGASRPTNRWSKVTRTLCLDLSNQRLTCSVVVSLLVVLGGLLAVLSLLLRSPLPALKSLTVHNASASGSLVEKTDSSEHSSGSRIVRLERIILERGIGPRPQQGAPAQPNDIY